MKAPDFSSAYVVQQVKDFISANRLQSVPQTQPVDGLSAMKSSLNMRLSNRRNSEMQEQGIIQSFDTSNQKLTEEIETEPLKTEAITSSDYL